MSDQRQHRFQYIAIGLLSMGLLFVGPAIAWADESVVIDFVRHGETMANAAGIIDTDIPGDPLDSTGDAQALAVAELLAPQGPFAGLFESELTRTMQTADFLAAMTGMVPQVLPGLNEISAGVFNGEPEISLGGLYYLLAVFSWTLGAELVPIPGSYNGANGVEFQEGFDQALQAMYNGAADSGVVAMNGQPTDVAFSSEFAIEIGTLLNVNNPDPLLIFTDPLSNTGQVVIDGSPGDWTLVSWNGTAVPPASLPTDLFVDVRNLIEAPQFADYNIYEALLTGNLTTIDNAIQAGVNQVDTALAQFPVAVFDDIVNAFSAGIPDLGNELSAAATDVAGLLPGDLSALVAETFAS